MPRSEAWACHGRSAYAGRYARCAEYHVELIFLGLPSADAAVARVAARVKQGGHDVPEAVIRRRFAMGLKNVHAIYKLIVNGWMLYDSGGDAQKLLETGENR